MQPAQGGWKRFVSSETARYFASRLVTTMLIVFGAMLLLFSLTRDRSRRSGVGAARAAGDAGICAALHRARWGSTSRCTSGCGRFFGNVLTGNLGVDVISGRPVAAIIASVMPYTIVLTFTAIGLAVLIGVPLGVFAATHRGSAVDHVLAFISRRLHRRAELRDRDHSCC